MKNKNFYKLINACIIVLSIICLSSCFYCIEGSNVIRTENRTNQVSAFKEIELRGDFDINFTQDTSINYEVLLEGDDNIIPYISTNVSGERLIIEYNTSKCFNHSNNLDLKIRANDLAKLIIEGSGNTHCNKLITSSLNLQISGSGNISFDDLTLNTLKARISGSGNISLSGTTNTSDISISGSGSFGTYDLLHDTCNATISGSGSIEIAFTNQLNANISGSGNIYYKGDRNKVHKTVSGSGGVYQQNK
jgi:hypothetical protein